MNELNNTGEADFFNVVRAPRKVIPPARPSGNWLTTFADMSTLLLTFLVLLISVTSQDPRDEIFRSDGQPEQREEIISGSGFLLYSDRGLMAPVIELTENIDRLPEAVMFDQSEIKTAIFQLDPAHTPEYEQLQAGLDQKVEVVKDSRGLVVRWDRSLLFAEGQAEIYQDNLVLMDKLALFLKNINLPLSIEGHTDPLSPVEGGYGTESYELSFKRAKAVMSLMASQGIDPSRLRLVGHGGLSPRSLERESSWENSRLEIVIYKPPPARLFAR